jgi:hypothetical protein
MTENEELLRGFLITVYWLEDGRMQVNFGMKGPQAIRSFNGEPPQIPRYIVVVRPEGDGVAFDWIATQPGEFRTVMEAEAKTRWRERAAWIEHINSLVAQVDQWAREMDWSTRRVDKKLDDTRIGKHQVTALLMQADTCRILLEPIGSSAPDVEGVADLYLMPAYDDIARLSFYGGQWHLHYTFQSQDPIRTEGAALSKELLGRVLTEMKANAA